ncbi:SpoIIE family protein phosphatase [Nonomuraea sp. NN258]|uniref:SpoIIE family protein phosphatase n=1 Tax=Nonomuraea antri TaxID=2730852 RepID=UPI00156A2649|nr:SpoIIE family protein phosphatase [Nonomuraea antri]NRQ36880.1 SpoIIE family protein phosphatase [Nonomuraea antri]
MRSQRRWPAVVLLVEAAVAAATALTSLPLAGLLLAGPLLAAWRMSVRATAAVAAAAVVLAAGFDLLAGHGRGGTLVVAAGGLYAVMTARRLRPARPPAAAPAPPPAPVATPAGDDVALAVHARAATDEIQLGSSLYETAAGPFGLRLIVGDVKSSGAEAAGLCALTLAAFRQAAATEPDLTAVAAAIDVRVGPHLGLEDFIPVLLAEFAPGEVRLVNCGHPAPVRVGRRLDPLEPPEPSPPLGVGPRPRLQRARLGGNQRLLLFSGGLGSDELGELDDDMRHALTAPGLDEALDNLLELLDVLNGPAGDHLTVALAQPVPERVAAREVAG